MVRHGTIVETSSVLSTLQVARTNDTESKLEKCLDEAESASKASDQSSQFQILESATLINTIFTANRADSNGGAIFTQVSCFMDNLAPISTTVCEEISQGQ